MAITFRAGTSASVQSATASFTVPGTVQVGDLMLACIFTGNSGTLTAPAGWTALPGADAGHVESAGNWYVQIVYKVATVSDPGSTVSWTVGTGPKSTMVFAAYAGVDQSAPFDAQDIAIGTASTTHATPSITVADEGWTVSFCGDRGSPSSTSLTPDAGFTTRASGFGTGSGSTSVAIADSGTEVSNGSQDTGDWAATVSTSNSFVASIALTPATTAGITAKCYWYGRLPLRLFAKEVGVADTWTITAHSSSMTPNLDTDDYANDLTNELSTANGYTAGGETLTSVAIVQDATNHRCVVSFDPVTWTVPSGTLGPIRYFAIRKNTGTASTSPLIMLIDCETDASSDLAIGVYPDPVNGVQVVTTPTGTPSS